MKYDWFINYTQDVLKVNSAYQFGMKDADELGKALKENEPSAQFVMGNLLDGNREYQQAAYFYSLAAQQSYAPAEHHLALCYYLGEGVEEDEDLCKYWMSRAVNDGAAVAALFMGQRYDESMTNKPFCNQNDRISTYWYFIGAKMGNKICMNNLGYNYQNGVGVDKSDIFATYWYNKAAEGGLDVAIKWRKNNPTFSWDTEKIKKFENTVLKHRIIKFGKYYIGKKDTKEPIEWIVCAEDDDYMVLVSKNSLKVMNYSEGDSAYGWENSKIRAFLNGEFIVDAFSKEEKMRLLPQFSQNELNPIYETESGSHPRDLVSIPDTFDLALRLNIDEWGCQNVPASERIIFQGHKYDQWWLRNGGEPGRKHKVYGDIVCNDFYYSCVDSEGKINYKGMGGCTCACGVRPLILVKKEKDKKVSAVQTKITKSDASIVQQIQWKKSGLCRYCGGEIKGLFNKKCVKCGKKKDY